MMKNRNLFLVVFLVLVFLVGTLLPYAPVQKMDSLPNQHIVVRIDSRATVSSFDGTIVTSLSELTGVEASINPALMEVLGWSAGRVVSSQELLHSVGDTVRVVPNSGGGYTIVYSERGTAILGLAKIGIQIVSRVLEDLDSP